ncbi:uncharacterized protein LOC126798389 isoform X2 [Argentina anserina]|uniref:uncharacterized protein LOC126798389 isoform X2 n=1 Tax=Argentina anserina TaxID=57926 RepID=UPI00217680DE|nr:uncharacterized protein LOC126798389 isoform X2 [Potentilla anserina]
MRASDSTKRICSRKSESSLGAVPAAELVNIELDDLPDVVLVEILCRLPCYKFVLKCKSVSKRWFNVMSGPYFLGRFLCLQSDRDETPIIRSLITDTGQEFLNRMATTTKPLGPLFEKLMSVQQLEKEPIVVATYNDLVLCSTTGFYQRDYYICNPCTIQWVAVPPPPRVYKYTPVGLICDLPYFNCTKDDQGGSVIQVNAEFRCRIVRIVLPENESVTELEVQIFASDTSQWITSTISIPSGVICDTVPIERSFTYNGMLYFVGDEPGDQNFLLGLDPFLINNSIIERYQFIRFDDPEESFVLRYFGEYRGCLHMCDYDHYKFFVRELKAEELCGGAGKLSVEGMTFKQENGQSLLEIFPLMINFCLWSHGGQRQCLGYYNTPNLRE